MERAEKIGLGVATAGHVLLFGLLSAGFLRTPNPLRLNTPPMDVSLVDEVALKSMGPQISTRPPPPSVAPEPGPAQDAAPAPEPSPEPEPAPEPAPAPPAPRAKPAPASPKVKPAPPKRDMARVAPKPKPAPEKPAPAPKSRAAPKKPSAPAPAAKKAAPAKPKADSPARASGQGKADRPRGSLIGGDFLKGIDTSADAPRRAPAPPAAAAIGPAQKAALDAEIRRQLKPHWKAPAGADADLLRTELSVQLSSDGAVIGTPRVIRQTGITPSNRSQAALHAEQAIRAVRLASPFRLPPQFYDQWKTLEPLGFDRRLSQ